MQINGVLVFLRELIRLVRRQEHRLFQGDKEILIRLGILNRL